MRTLLLLLAFLSGGGAYLSYSASQQLYYGTPWANTVCSAANIFCRHPEWLAYGAGGFVVLALLAGLVRSTS
jgi:hypothetical protein